MPRPTTAQLVYGSLTVVLSTLAALLLSDVRSGAAVAAVAAAGLVLGVLVAVAVTMPAVARRRAAARPAPLRPTAVPLPRSRVPGGAEPRRVGEHSLRR
ncbi:MMPL family transporter [Streptomyces sp. NPDC020983]|uniref:MMPL family transporter n=1 Tax=Streptomyces sp. NPDC020983 TaxID=3365106 RepID=UPI003787E080